jgi:predicted RND superfamily exporter protein
VLVTRLARSSHAFAVSTLTTLLGFGSLMFTSTPALQSLGRIMSVAVVVCMLATSFIVVPVVVRGMKPQG